MDMGEGGSQISGVGGEAGAKDGSEAGADRLGGDGPAVGGAPVFSGGGILAAREPRAWKPFAIAGAAVLLVLLGLVLAGRHASRQANPGGAGLAPLAAYASSLPITGVQMSDSSNLSGGKETYLDGTITNRGGSTVTAITVQVGFKDFTGMLAAKETLPLNLIHFREPYVDTESVGANPIKPGEARGFRLIFDAAPQSWNGEYPQVRVISVETR